MFAKINPLDNLTLIQLERFIDIHKPIMLLLSIVCYFFLIYSVWISPVSNVLMIFVVYYFLGTMEQIFFHRRFAHKAWQAHKWLDFIGLWISASSLLGNAMTYTSHHRIHHKFSDKPLDPHSPHHKNHLFIQFLFPYYQGSIKYAHDIASDPMQRFFGTYTIPIIIVNWALIYYFVSYDFLTTIWLPGTAMFLLIKNYLNIRLHKPSIFSFGYKNKDISDRSYNNLFWGYFSFDGWHQNHHSYPSSWYYGRRWWELDIPGIVIGLLSILTLQFQNFKKLN